MAIIEGAKQRVGVEAGVAGDLSGYGPFVYASTVNGGTPGSGTFAAGTANPGAICMAPYANAGATPKLFVNTGTALAVPVWTVAGTQS